MLPLVRDTSSSASAIELGTVGVSWSSAHLMPASVSSLSEIPPCHGHSKQAPIPFLLLEKATVKLKAWLIYAIYGH